MSTLNTNKENVLQIMCCNYLTLLETTNKICTFFAIPNGIKFGAKNNFAYAIQKKKEGLRPGVSDIIIILKTKILCIEFKRSKNHKQTLHQKTFEQNIAKSSVCEYHVIWDFDSFVILINDNI